MILIGVFLFRRETSPQAHDLGRVFIGFGLVLLALHQLIEIMSPYENSPTMRQLLSLVSTAPLLDVILAAALTWAVQFQCCGGALDHVHGGEGYCTA